MSEKIVDALKSVVESCDVYFKDGQIVLALKGEPILAIKPLHPIAQFLVLMLEKTIVK